MRRTPGTPRTLFFWLTLVALLAGCQSNPTTVPISSDSSLLAVDVLYPTPLGRDHSLVQVFFVRGPIHAGLRELPELIPATFVKNSRAYLLDPVPGTYSVVAVTSQLVPPLNNHPIAGGVTRTVLNEQLGHVVVLPAELIQRTRTTIRPGEATFMGALRVRRGERIKASAVLQDDLQQRIAEQIRPGVTSQSGPVGWISITWMVDLEETTYSDDAVDREAFLDAALADLGDSPWSQVIDRAARRGGSSPQASEPEFDGDGAAPVADAAASEPPGEIPSREPAISESSRAASDSKLAIRTASKSPAEPKRRVVAGIPPDSPLSKIELGMHHSDVRKLLGDPDERVDRLTAKAWIPFNNAPGARLIDWVYVGVGRVVFSQHTGRLLVFDVIADPGKGKESTKPGSGGQ